MESRSLSIGIFSLPYAPIKQISNILDFNHKWRELGGLMQYDVISLEAFSRAVLGMNSPSEKMILDWGNKGHSVWELFFLLSQLQQYRAMHILKPFVNPKYHHYLKEIFHCEPEIFKSLDASNISDDLPTPDFSDDHKEFLPSHPDHMIPCENNETIPLEPCTKDSKELCESPDTFYGEALNKKPFHFSINSTEKSALQTFNFEKDSCTINEPNKFISPSKNDIKFNETKADLDKRGESCVKSEHMPGQDEEKKSIMIFSHSTTIPYSEIIQSTNNFDSAMIIGQGSFGIVYIGKWRQTVVAIKRIITKIEDGKDSDRIRQSLTEIQNLPLYQHDNILPLYGYSLDGLEPCIIYMYMVNGSLEDQLACKNNSVPLNWNQRYQIITGAARGIQFLHTNKPSLIHGDIKSSNILLDKSYEPRLGDFGLARVGETDLATHVSTKTARETTPYLPSEYLRSRKLSTQVDVYSFGVVLYEVATGLKANVEKQYLTDYISDQKECDIYKLQDPKAGKDVYNFFSSFMEIGKHCSSDLKKNRPDMMEVLLFFEQLLGSMLNNSVISGNVPVLTNFNEEYDNVQQIKEPETSNQIINGLMNTHIIDDLSPFPCIIQEDKNIVEIPYMSAKFKSLPF